MKGKRWYDYLWLWAIVYFSLGFCNILCAWLGLVDVLLPLVIAFAGGDKFFCNHLCGRGQLFMQLGYTWHVSRGLPTPAWLRSKVFRYGFLVFFCVMFGNMLLQTWLVASGAATMRETVAVLWTFHVPWDWAYTAGSAAPWVAQLSFGLYSIMLSSLLLGLVVMVLYRPRTWCAFCPMGTMTQAVCKWKNRGAGDGTR